MPSFDIVSKTDLSEVDNAVANLMREVGQRYDFKGSNAKVERVGPGITIQADDDLKRKQLLMERAKAASALAGIQHDLKELEDVIAAQIPMVSDELVDLTI